jgi:hypothetical protein
MVNQNFRPNRRGFAPIFVVIIIAIVLVVGYLWWARNNKSSVQNQNGTNSSSTEQVPNASSTDTSGWKTYRNTGLGFQIMYPPIWQISEKIISLSSMSTGVFRATSSDVLFRDNTGQQKLDIFEYKNWTIDELVSKSPYHEITNVSVGGKKAVMDASAATGGWENNIFVPKSDIDFLAIIYTGNNLPVDRAKKVNNFYDQLLATFKFVPSTSLGVNPPVACTEEAKQCPDGSYVGRTGSNCAFAACQIVSGSSTALTARNGILSGSVTVGPICPVERVGVPCPVPSVAYTSREVIVYAANGSTIVARKNFNPDGTYSFSLPAGSYVVNTPNSGIGGARNLPQTVTIKSGQTTTLDFSIDTGIR